MVVQQNIKKLFQKRVGIYLALFATIANVVISPLATAAGAVDMMTIDKQVNAYTYYYAWAKCADNTDKWDGGSTSISIDDAAAGRWFATGTGLGEEDGHVGRLISPSNGILDCNGTDIVTNALSTWGFSSDKTSVLVNDFKFTKDGDKYKAPDKYRTAIFSAIRNKAFGGQTPTMIAAAKYYFYSQSFLNACSPSLIASPTADQKAAADSGSSKQYGHLKEYDPATKKIVDNYFELSGDKKMDSTVDGLVEGTGDVGKVLGGAYSDGEAQCQTLVNDANKLAGAYQLYAQGHPDLVPQDTGSKLTANNTAGASTCVIEGVGWIVCPVVRTIAFMVDKVYALLQAMLQTPPLPMEPDTSSNPLYGAWSGMRNVANVIFVLAFIIIIYSQVTSAGISNYGIKKLLPKLIVSAILINVSFWLCALAVDLSNVLGGSIYGFLSNIGGGGGNGSWSGVIEVLLAGAAAGTIAVGGVILAASVIGSFAGLASALLWLAIPMLIAVAVAILVGATVLALRQALIIILVFVSPLAFAAYLLPNTQDWFDKWRKLFITMLVFYPLFSILFGGASIASRVLISAASNAPAGTSGILLLTGMTVQFLPLFLVITLIKTSSGLLGRVAGQIQGRASGAANPISKMARQRTQENMGLAKGKLLTGNAQATNRFGRRTIGARASGLMQKFDSDARSRKFESEKLDSQRDANWQEQVAQDPYLMNTDYDTRAAKERGRSAERVQTEQYVNALKSSGSPLATTAGGIDRYGATRAQASAIQADFKAFDEHVAAEKALLSDSGVLADTGGGLSPAAGSLDAMVRDTSLSVEQRSAAASRLISTGADKNIHEMLNYLGTTSDAGADTVMKQVGADIGARRPKSLGQADVSALTTGTYSGDFDTKVIGRIHNGKQSGESLSSASADELDRMIKVLSAPGSAPTTPEATASRAALASSIDEYYTSAATSGRQVPDEIKTKMDAIKGLL